MKKTIKTTIFLTIVSVIFFLSLNFVYSINLYSNSLYPINESNIDTISGYSCLGGYDGGNSYKSNNDIFYVCELTSNQNSTLYNRSNTLRAEMDLTAVSGSTIFYFGFYNFTKNNINIPLNNGFSLKFNMSGKYTTGGSGSDKIGFHLFLSDGNNYKFCDKINGVSSSCEDFINVSLSATQINNTNQEYSFSYESLNKENVDLTAEKLEAISFYIDHDSSLTSDIFVNVSNLRIENNELPVFNVTFNKTNYCINDTYETIEVNYNIDAYDNEGDTIYYSLKTNENDLFSVAEFDNGEIAPVVCKYGLDFSFIGIAILPNFRYSCQERESLILINTPQPEVENINNACRILENTTSEFYISEQASFINDTRYMLVLSKNCDKRKEAYLKYDFGYLQNFRSDINLYYLRYITANHFNVSFYVNPYYNDILIRLKFNYTSSDNLDVWNYNSSDEWEFIDNISTLEHHTGLFNHLGISVNYDYANNKYNLSLGNSYKAVNYSNISTNTEIGAIISHFGLSSAGVSDIHLQSVGYGGQTLSPEWTTTKPTSTSITGEGQHILSFYVTDNVYKDLGEFSYKAENVILSKDSCIYETTPIITDNTTISGLQAVGGLLNDFCGALNGLGSIFGLSYNTCTIFLWFYILFALVVSLGVVFGFGYIAGLDLGLSAGGFMFFIFGYIATFIFTSMSRNLNFLFILVGAVAFVNLMRSIFMGFGSGING